MQEGKEANKGETAAPALPTLPADLDSLPQDQQIAKLIEHV